MSRPALKSLLEDIEKGEITKVITFEASRLSRDFMNFLGIMMKLAAHNVELEIPGKGIQSFATSTDKLLMAVQAFTANQFLEDHNNRVKAGMARAIEACVKLGAAKGGPSPNKGRLKQHDEKLVEKVLGLHSEGLPCRKIGAALDTTHSLANRIITRYS